MKLPVLHYGSTPAVSYSDQNDLAAGQTLKNSWVIGKGTDNSLISEEHQVKQ